MQVLPGKKKDRIWTRLDHFACCMVLVLMRGCKATQGLQIVHPKSLTRSNVGKPFKTKESAGVIYENSSLRSCLVGCAHKEEITTGMDAWRLPQTEYTTPGNGLAQQRENDSKRNPGKKWKNINTRETDESKHKQKRERQRSWKATIGYIQNWSNRSRYYHLLPTVAVAMAARRHLGSGKRRYTCGELLYNRQQHEVWRQV